MPAAEFDGQRWQIFHWFEMRPMIWIGKHMFPPNSLGKSQETWARRVRELVELGYLERKRVGRLAYYRFNPDTYKAIPKQGELL